MNRRRMLVSRMLGGGGNNVSQPLPFTDDFARANGALGGPWLGAETWQIVSGHVINVPNEGGDVVVNGGFDADSDWTKGAGWSISGGKAVANATSQSLLQTNLSSGIWYKLRFTTDTVTGGVYVPALAGIGTDVIGSGLGSNLGVRSAVQLALSNLTSGIACSNLSGTFDNVSCKSLRSADLFKVIPTNQTDVAVGVRVSGSRGGVVINLDSHSNPRNFALAIIRRISGGWTAVLYKCVNGLYTPMIATGISYVDLAVVQIRKIGTTYQLFYNGVQVGADQTISDLSIINNTLHGVFSTDLSQLDDFTLQAPPF